MGELTSIAQAAAELQAKLERARNLKPGQNRAASTISGTQHISASPIQCDVCHDREYIVYATPLGGEPIALPWHVTERMYLDEHPGAVLSAGDCECQRRRIAQAQLDRLMGEGGVPKIYRAFSFDSWDALPERDRRGKEAARAYCEAFGQGNFYVEGQERFGLVLSGDTGRGKTGLASCTLIERARRGEVVLWIDFNRFIRRVKDTYQDEAQASYEQIVGAAASVPFLFIDDIGDMKRRGEASDHTRNVLYDVIGERYNELLPTLITLNLSLSLFRYQFGTRIADRIAQLYHWVDVAGTNMRISE